MAGPQGLARSLARPRRVQRALKRVQELESRTEGEFPRVAGLSRLHRRMPLTGIENDGAPIGSSGTGLEEADIAAATTLGRHRDQPSVKALGTLSEVADQAQALAICGAVLGAGVLLRRPKLAEAGGRMLASVVIATAIKAVTKQLVSRTRPHVLLDQDRYAFEPLGPKKRDWNSFPSGHTADAVAAARALVRLYPSSSTPAYVVAGGIAAIQVPRARHYPLDVAAGAAIGVVAELIVNVAAARLLEFLTARAEASARREQNLNGRTSVRPSRERPRCRRCDVQEESSLQRIGKVWIVGCG